MSHAHRPALFILAMFAPFQLAMAQVSGPPEGNAIKGPDDIGRRYRDAMPTTKDFQNCMAGFGVADPECVARLMQGMKQKLYGDVKPGDKTFDQGARDADRFFGGDTDAPYADPNDSRRDDDDSFLYQRRFYGMPGLIGPRPPSDSPGAPGTE